LPSQLKVDLQKAASLSYRVKREHIFLDTHSGKKEKRPGFDKLRALVRTGAVKGLIIFCVDRFARKVIHALTVIAEFKQHGAKLDFVEKPFEDTPTGRFMMTNLSAVAEFIGEKTIEDSKRGCREKLEEGKLTHGSPPFGYRYIDEPSRPAPALRRPAFRSTKKRLRKFSSGALSKSSLPIPSLGGLTTPDS
jgi:DNA invertase Pin-like site-specific DNA recombinase